MILLVRWLRFRLFSELVLLIRGLAVGRRTFLWAKMFLISIVVFLSLHHEDYARNLCEPQGSSTIMCSNNLCSRACGRGVSAVYAPFGHRERCAA